MTDVVAQKTPAVSASPATMDVERPTGPKITLEIEVAQKLMSAKPSQVGSALFQHNLNKRRFIHKASGAQSWFSVKEVGRVVRDFLSKRSLMYEDGPIRWSAADDAEGAFLDSHVNEIRVSDTSPFADVLPGTWLMSWQACASVLFALMPAQAFLHPGLLYS